MCTLSAPRRLSATLRYSHLSRQLLHPLAPRRLSATYRLHHGDCVREGHEGQEGHEGHEGQEGARAKGTEAHEGYEGNDGHEHGDGLQAAVQGVYDYGGGEVSRARLPRP